MVKDLVVMGSGGIDIVQLIEAINADKKTYNFLGFLEKDETKIGTDVLGYPILGNDNLLYTKFNKCAVVNNIMHTPALHKAITERLHNDYGLIKFTADTVKLFGVYVVPVHVIQLNLDKFQVF